MHKQSRMYSLTIKDVGGDSCLADKIVRKWECELKAERKKNGQKKMNQNQPGQPKSANTDKTLNVWKIWLCQIEE